MSFAQVIKIPPAPLLILGSLAAAVFVACDKPVSPPSPPAMSVRAERQTPQEIPQFPEMSSQLLEVEIGIPVFARESEGSDSELISAVKVAGGRVFIGFKPHAHRPLRETGLVPAMTRAEAMAGRSAVQEIGARITRSFMNTSEVVAEISPELAPAIRDLPFVNYIEPVPPPGRILQEPPQIQDTTWGQPFVNADIAWYHGYRGTGAHISILDTGLDSMHVWSAYGDLNFAHTTDLRLAYVVGAGSSSWDDNGHGSLVNSIAVSTNGMYGYIGVAHEIQGIASVKVCDWAGFCDPPDVLGGLDWVLNLDWTGDRHIINMSFGQAPTAALRTRMQQHWNAGNILVAAAGNGGGIVHPARYDEVIAVTGFMQYGWFADGTLAPCLGLVSSEGSQAEISGPYWAYGMRLNRGYGMDCGTSFAAPVVSGVAAMIWERWPAYSNQQVRNRLQNTAHDVYPPGRDHQYGYGRVDACQAIGNCTQPPPPLSVTIVGPTVVKPYQTCSWVAVKTGGGGGTSYQWSGVLSGSGAEIYGALTGPGNLHVNVTSGGEQAADDHYITTSWSAPDCLF